MGTWQVTAVGRDFMKDGIQHDCELSGIVLANNPDEAFFKVRRIAMQDHRERQQAMGPFPRPVINADEIQKVPETLFIVADQVEVFWIKK